MRQGLQVDWAVVVSGKDRFGAEFSERAQLVELSEGGFSLMLYRPLTDGIRLAVDLHPDVPEPAHCVKVITTKVDTHFDSRQTVHVRVVELPQPSRVL